MAMTEERQGRSLRMAEIIDAYRIFPRIFLSLFFAGYSWLMVQSWEWYMSLDFTLYTAPMLAALTAFPVTLLTALGAMFTSIYRHYQASGRDWTIK